MKRMWIGAGLLAVLLAAGLVIAGVMENRLSPGGEELRRAGELALAEEWEKAEALTDSVRADWQKFRWLAAVLSTHDQMERIETAFDQLPACTGDGRAYCTLCTALAADLEGLAKTHSCGWENFF